MAGHPRDTIINVILISSYHQTPEHLSTNIPSPTRERKIKALISQEPPGDFSSAFSSPGPPHPDFLDPASPQVLGAVRPPSPAPRTPQSSPCHRPTHTSAGICLPRGVAEGRHHQSCVDNLRPMRPVLGKCLLKEWLPEATLFFFKS